MLLIISLKVLASLSISCKDMKGDDVDWFSVIKAPESSSPNNGEDFMYLDASNLSPSISNILINQPGAISYTLDQINSKTVSSVAFK
jgi:Deoxyribonuclease II